MKIRAALPLAAGLLAITPVVPAMAQSAQPSTPPLVQMAYQHLERLHMALRITPQQESAFNRFANVSMRDAAVTQRMFSELASDIQHMNAAQDLRDFADVQLQAVGDFQRVVPAFEHLYVELSPRQREMADMAFRKVAERHEQRWAEMARQQGWNGMERRQGWNANQQGWNNEGNQQGWNMNQQGWNDTGNQQGWNNRESQQGWNGTGQHGWYNAGRG